MSFLSRLGVTRGRTSRCKCGAVIVWIRMHRKPNGEAGGVMPCDYELKPGDGERTLVVIDEDGLGQMIVKAGRDILGREPHFGSCSRRSEFTR